MPRHNSEISGGKSETTKSAEEKPERTVSHYDATFAEFLARPGEEVIALSERVGRDQYSGERMLQDDDVVDFPWPVRSNERQKRQTIHATWTLKRGVGSDGRTAGLNVMGNIA
jgi:hypothetical protein